MKNTTSNGVIKCRPLDFVRDLIVYVVGNHECATWQAGTDIEPIDVHQIDENVGIGNDDAAWEHSFGVVKGV